MCVSNPIKGVQEKETPMAIHPSSISDVYSYFRPFETVFYIFTS